MRVDLKKKDLVRLIIGSAPDYEHFDYLESLGLGHFSGSYGYWAWEEDAVAEMSEAKLLELYKTITGNDLVPT